jgi:hypothetical protein
LASTSAFYGGMKPMYHLFPDTLRYARKCTVKEWSFQPTPIWEKRSMQDFPSVPW